MANTAFSPLLPLSKTPLVSCVIIFYNDEPFLSEAIESVLGQAYKNWELLLVDDGSTDGSAETAQKYVQSHPEKIQYLHHPHHQNRGKNASRNLGIEKAQGELVALLDGDDIWLPHKLKEQVAAFHQHPEAAMVYGRTQSWYTWTGNSQEQDCLPELGVAPDTLVYPPTLAMNLLKGLTQTPTTCNAILRRDVFDRVGNFDEHYHDIFEDQVFFVKVELNFPVFVADNLWANYRQHPGSSFNQFNHALQENPELRCKVRLQFFSWVWSYTIHQTNPDDEILQYLRTRNKALKKQLWWYQFFIYVWWRQILDSTVRLSRKVLPQSLRDWLWQLIGKRLYHIG